MAKEAPLSERIHAILDQESLAEPTARRLGKALDTVLWRLGLGGRPRGFYVPYRHADGCRRLGADQEIDWLRRDWEALVPRMAALATQAAAFNGRLRQFVQRPPDQERLPRFDQDWFSGLDAALAYALVRLHEPATILEVGSGHSTRFMYRALADSGLSTRLVSVDPAPRKPIDDLCHQVHRVIAQEADPALFTGLKSGDVLFLDGSHLAQPGTDVDFFLGQVLPRLAPGVLVHLHDIFLPHGYPDLPDWDWWAYNEQNAVLYMLGGGRRYTVLWASAFVRRHHPDLVADLVAPNPHNALESSLWLRVAGA